MPEFGKTASVEEHSQYALGFGWRTTARLPVAWQGAATGTNAYTPHFAVPSGLLSVCLVFGKTNWKAEEEAACFRMQRPTSQAPRWREKGVVSEASPAHSDPVANYRVLAETLSFG